MWPQGHLNMKTVLMDKATCVVDIMLLTPLRKRDNCNLSNQRDMDAACFMSQQMFHHNNSWWLKLTQSNLLVCFKQLSVVILIVLNLLLVRDNKPVSCVASPSFYFLLSWGQTAKLFIVTSGIFSIYLP